MSQKKGWNIWWNLLRPHTLTASFVPVLLGTILALQITEINILLFLAMLLASILIQAATNMFNEYYDYKRGLDHAESVGIGGAIVREGVHPTTILALALSFFGISMLLGIYICASSSWWLAAIGSGCMLVAYLYTGGPFPIAYTPFGEIFAGLFMGLGIILIAFFIQTGQISTTVMLVSVPSSILIGAILLANNIRDLDGDKENGRKTLAILVGHKHAISVLAMMFIVSFIWVIGLFLMDVVPFWTFLIFLSVPKAIKATKGFIGKKKPIEMMPAMQATAQTNTMFGFLLAIGLAIGQFM